MRKIESVLRSSMAQERMYNLALLNTEQDIVNTRSSADADNRLDALSGQSRSTNMVPFHM